MSKSPATPAGERTKPSGVQKRIPLHLFVNNHFDLIWRRCYRRKLEFDGQISASYAELEDWYVEDNLVLAKSRTDYVFEIECTELPLAPHVESDGVRLSSLKQSEDGRSLIALLVEFRGRSSKARLVLPPGWQRVNLLEEPISEIAIDEESTATLSLKPWEIATVYLAIAPRSRRKT